MVAKQAGNCSDWYLNVASLELIMKTGQTTSTLIFVVSNFCDH